MGHVKHDTVDEVTLGIPGAESDLTGFFQVLGLKPPTAFPPGYNKMCHAVSASGKTAMLVVPKKKLTTHLQETLRGIQDVLCDKENADYLVTYLSIKRFLQSFVRASIDMTKLGEMIEECKYGTVKNSLESLLPLDDGLARKIEYSMTGTATGRLTVKRGPQILTIPGPARKCLKSSFVKGKVLQIDIVSAEPKFALYLKGIKPPRDVYSHIAESILENQVTRSQAKLITLCALYGQSIKKLGEQLPESVGPRGVIQKTKTYFDRDYLLSRLKNESKVGILRSAVGRPLNVPDENPHLLVSYYLQSSVAEASILMFSRFIEETELNCRPMFVIHDALIVDCDKDTAQTLLDNQNLKLSLGDWKFDAEVKVVGDI